MTGQEIEVYKQFGIAALFILMYLGTVWFLIKQLIKNKEDSVKQTRELVLVVQSCTQAMKDNQEASESLTTKLEDFIARQLEALAYQKGQEQERRRNRS